MTSLLYEHVPPGANTEKLTTMYDVAGTSCMRRLAGTEASCIDNAVRFEQGPEEVICDLPVIKKRDEP